MSSITGQDITSHEEKAMKHRILVTGGTGFAGSHLVRRLLHMGHEVVALDNQKGIVFDELAAEGAEIHIGSVTDRQLVNRLVQGCDIVFHLAAAFRKVDLPKEVYWDINVNGTRYLLEAAYEAKVARFVYCSTCGVHGNVENPPAAEDAPIAPEDYYQFTKYEGEKVVHEFMQRGLPAAILRPAAIYGPGDPERWAMLFKRVARGWFPMLGNGKVTYHPLYIDNLTDAFVLAMEKDAALGQTYLIADDCYYPIEEIVKMVAQVLEIDVKIYHLPYFPVWFTALLVETAARPFKISPPIFRRRVDWFRQNRAFDISKARKELGYNPRVDLLEGLRRTAEWYREHNLI